MADHRRPADAHSETHLRAQQDHPTRPSGAHTRQQPSWLTCDPAAFFSKYRIPRTSWSPSVNSGAGTMLCAGLQRVAHTDRSAANCRPTSAAASASLLAMSSVLTAGAGAGCRVARGKDEHFGGDRELGGKPMHGWHLMCAYMECAS